MKILVVDDADEKVAEVTAILQLAGDGRKQIDVGSTGLDARERLASTQYDLLILDLKLPLRKGDEPDRKGGINLLMEITLSDRFFRPTHVIALTGFEDLRREFETKFNDGQWTIETYDPSDAGWRERLRAKATYIERTIEQAGQTYDTDLCVLSALPSPELDAVRSLPWNWSEAEALDSVTFLYRGEVGSEGFKLSVVAAASPRMGMVASAALVQKLVHTVRPRMLVMTGICAGARGNCELGDVLVADPCWDWQMGKYLQEVFEIGPDQLSIPLEVRQRMALLSEDRKLFIHLSETFQGEKPNHIPKLLIGPLASGSAVLADDATLDVIKRQHRKLLGVDMELYGVYSSVRDCSAPRPITFGLKGVCDFADHLKNDKYQKYASFMSAQVLRVFVERFCGQLIPQAFHLKEAAIDRQSDLKAS